MAQKNKKTAFANKAGQTTNTATAKPSNYSFATEQKPKKKPFNLPSWLWITIVPILIAAVGFYYLYVENSDVLYMAQLRSFFSYDKSFLDQCLLQPDGLILYVSSYLTQLFYNPIVGVLVLIVLWIASFFVAKKAFDIPNSLSGILAVPATCLLLGIVGVGYWIYYIKQPGYWFVGSIGYLTTMCIVLIHRLLHSTNNDTIIRKSLRLIFIVLVAASYYYIGWFSLLALLYIAVNSIFLYIRTKQNKSLPFLLAEVILPLVGIGIVPLLFYNHFCELRIEDAWTCGFYDFEQSLSDSASVVDNCQRLPYIILAILPILYPALSLLKTKINGFASLFINIAIITVAGYWFNSREYTDYNYKAEMRMYKAAMDNDWDGVLTEMTDLPHDATRQMVLLKNIALFNNGKIGDMMFKYNNKGREPFVPDTFGIVPRLDKGEPVLNDKGEQTMDTLALHPHLVQTAGPYIYLQHGKTNFSYRWLVENMVEYGPKNGDLQLLAINCLINEENVVAKKYLTILQSTPNYKDWADRYIPITDGTKKVKDFPEFSRICELRDHMGSILDGDNGLPEMYLINYFSNTMNKDDAYLQEMTLLYSLVSKDIQLFWPRFFLYAQMHKDVQRMPRHYQEAAYLYGHLERNVDISKMPFDKEVVDSYNNFQNASNQLMQTQQRLNNGKINEQQIAEDMKALYGDTFYWFYFFCRGVHSY